MITKREIDAIESSLREAWIVLGRAKRRLNAQASREKAKQNGTKVGRKRTRNDRSILSLRAQGLSIRKIAQVEGVSTAAVQRALREPTGH